eukprot:293484_1
METKIIPIQNHKPHFKYHKVFLNAYEGTQIKNQLKTRKEHQKELKKLNDITRTFDKKYEEFISNTANNKSVFGYNWRKYTVFGFIRESQRILSSNIPDLVINQCSLYYGVEYELFDFGLWNVLRGNWERFDSKCGYTTTYDEHPFRA